ncbi:MAG: UTP--glucose-1-phosphate uridylyltransferase [Planctomycetota bacterium]
MAVLAERYTEYTRILDRHGQGHLLAFWPQLSDAQRHALLADLDQIDFERLMPLVETHVRRRPTVHIPEHIDPPVIYPAEPGPEHRALYERARARGIDAIRAGRVAAFTVAGGQGTRLGFDGPKGAYPITPVRNAPLFQVFAESLLGIERRYGRRPRWYIMTSPANHSESVAFFEANRFFGLRGDDVTFFPQGQAPVFLPDGRIALAERHRVALSPDGHGGSLRALAASGALADMRSRGIDVISYFQVDNPLVRTVDPLFIGLHLDAASEMSSKAVHKATDKERVGNFCLVDRRVTVIEYSDLPDDLAHARNADGSRRFDAGSIAIHVLSREFVERLTTPGSDLELPWHRADKKVDMIDEHGRPVKPQAPNAVKLEMFIFDAVPLAQRPLVMFTPRAEEFSPVKNPDGVDSAVTARRDLVRRAARWLESCGVSIPRGTDGEPAMPLEISPAYALDADDLRERLARGARPAPRPGQPLLL